MPKKLAITIAGAVSLGSYEAGVLFEVLDAIRQHNTNPATAPNDHIIIDVLTGASAGGMTAIILAQKLLYSWNEFVGPYENPLYHLWVERISLDGLEDTERDEPAIDSIFSSDLVVKISNEALKQRYATVPVPAAQPYVGVGDSIRVGVAITNLNGVGYSYEVHPDGQFTYLNYADQLTRYAVAAKVDNADFWEDLRQAAVACGAFPYAFRTQDISRSAKKEPDDYSASNLENWDHDPMIFTYSDGGILQNQPIGIAKNLVDLNDKHLNQEKRYYLFVSPHAKDPRANDSFHSAGADYFHLTQRLAGVILGQSGFQDWITAKGVNERIKLLDQRASGLCWAIQNGKIDVACLATTAKSLLLLFFPNGEHLSPGANKPETLVDAQDRIAKQYKVEMTALGAVPAEAEAFRDSVLAFETAAGLGARDQMTIYGVIADESELAGAGLQAFLGFFDQKFRDHDYDVGRLHARTVLQSAKLADGNGIGPIHYTSSPIRPIDSRWNGLKLRDVPVADLSDFKKGLRKRLNEMLKELLGPVFSLPALPGADLLLDVLLDAVIHKL